MGLCSGLTQNKAVDKDSFAWTSNFSYKDSCNCFFFFVFSLDFYETYSSVIIQSSKVYIPENTKTVHIIIYIDSISPLNLVEKNVLPRFHGTRVC